MYGYINSDDLRHTEKQLFTFSEVARAINKKGFGRTNLMLFLRENKILNKDNIPRADLINDGSFKIRKNKLNYYSSQPTQKGLKLIKSLID